MNELEEILDFLNNEVTPYVKKHGDVDMDFMCHLERAKQILSIKIATNLNR